MYGPPSPMPQTSPHPLTPPSSPLPLRPPVFPPQTQWPAPALRNALAPAHELDARAQARRRPDDGGRGSFEEEAQREQDGEVQAVREGGRGEAGAGGYLGRDEGNGGSWVGGETGVGEGGGVCCWFADRSVAFCT